MKKVVVLGLSLVMALSMSLTAFATNGGFISSPKHDQAPTKEEVLVDNEEFQEVAESIEIKPFANREELPPEVAKKVEEAYEQITSINKEEGQDLTDVVKEEHKEALKNIVAEKNISTENLAVSDLFDISAENYNPDEFVTDLPVFTIKLKVEINNFVALLHYINGGFEVVDGATYENGVLSFEVSNFSPFAIVVDASQDVNTGDNSNLALYVVVAVVAAGALVFCWKKSKKVA